VRRGLALGFPAYAAFTYFVFYGDDHLSDPIALPERPRPGLAWRAAAGLLGKLMGRSAKDDPCPAPQPEAPAKRPRERRASAGARLPVLS